jgi:DNA-binding response OmpR family regulator
MKRRILVVEDDSALARILRDNLTFEGFDVDWAEDGLSAVTKSRAFCPDLIVLDVMLPDGSGFDLLGVLRQGNRTPVIILTARDQKKDKLHGLHIGADDYVTKPFDLEEFIARVHAVFRRVRPPIERLTLGDVVIDFEARVATRQGRAVHLTNHEFELLKYLAERQHRVVYRDELLREVWGYPMAPITRSVDHAISRLRKKVEADPHSPRFIHTVHGGGYRMTITEPRQRQLATFE